MQIHRYVRYVIYICRQYNIVNLYQFKKNIFNLIQFNHVFDMPRIKYNARHFLVFRAIEFVYFEATRKL